MTLSATGIRFVQHQQAEVAAGVKGENVTTVSSRKKAEADLFKDGNPLPDYGVCSHYKKSHRWLRYVVQKTEIWDHQGLDAFYIYFYQVFLSQDA